ncbi:hypothetical protein GWA01_03690 [Gluconobacter wancherniae NBRC 103581]|uniref:Uncharacterized protein n=1 Tax=Gluconobacter wancherniae NBRC 103581 TaxID=656744 RepID=A0A511AWL5_9PROT|nr:hypothetical protein AA103581_1086 [Gluconobacter wancherniae NBRC 103581]GEK92599.1 hypothetical protein GWA01_03690 [Gluconobacter wancherniae NBRC 103581]
MIDRGQKFVFCYFFHEFQSLLTLGIRISLLDHLHPKDSRTDTSHSSVVVVYALSMLIEDEYGID